MTRTERVVLLLAGGPKWSSEISRETAINVQDLGVVLDGPEFVVDAVADDRLPFMYQGTGLIRAAYRLSEAGVELLSRIKRDNPLSKLDSRPEGGLCGRSASGAASRSVSGARPASA